MDKSKPRDWNEERWTRPFQSAKDPTNLLEFVPWKERAWRVDKDPRQFKFAIVCNHCDIFRNSLGSMRKHLESCPERKMPDLRCGHCARHFSKWCKLAEHLNVPGMEMQKACKPCFKLPYVSSPTLAVVRKRAKKTALNAAGKGAKSTTTQIQYNSWRNVHPKDVKALRREATKVWEGNFREPVVVSLAQESTENSSEGTASRQVLVVSFPDVEPDDVSVPFGRTSALKLPRHTSTATSDIVASVTVSFAPLQGVEATSLQTACSAPDVLPTPACQVVAAELVDEDTDAANALLREFFERSEEYLGQPILPLSPGLATPAIAAWEVCLPREVILSCDRETHPTPEEVPLLQRAGEAEIPPLRRSGSVTSTVPDDVAGHNSEALAARPKTPLREPQVSSSEEDAEPEAVRVVANTEVQIKQESGDIIIISSPETDNRATTSSDLTALRQELFSLRRQNRSYLRQLCFWAETVAKLGGELNRVPTESESKLRDKLVACGDWPPHMATSVDAGFQDLGYRFSDMYRAMLHQMSSE